MTNSPTIALVACEESGDYLGGELMRELKNIFPQAKFIGVGGESMQKQGMKSFFPLEELTALGIVEILHRLPKLLSIRKNLANTIAKHKPDIYIGIDAPDFNLAIEEKVRAMGIKSVHYVSPTVWAWRPGRIKKIAKATDMVLCLYPFEIDYYQQQGAKMGIKVNAVYVGHPLADKIPLVNDKQKARQELGLSDESYIALLPGSRKSEQRNMGNLFIQTVIKCLEDRNDLNFIIAAVNQSAADYFAGLLKSHPLLADKFHIFTRNSRKVMTAADFVLLASGTASLECMLIKRPMISVYRIPLITYIILKQMVKIPYISQPNWLHGEEVVKEFIQGDAKVEKLAPAILQQLNAIDDTLNKKYTAMHKLLQRNASHTAAQSIASLL